MTGRIIYPVNAGVNPDTVVSDYLNKSDEFDNTRAFTSVSVNPILKAIDLEEENSTSTSDFVASAIFTEIRNTSHNLGISNDSTDRVGNRLLPTSANLSDYSSTHVNSPSFKIKIYNADVSNTAINRKVTYAVNNNYPASATVGIDIDNYDYFILLNPEIVSVGTDTVRPHFAKITNIIAFDEFGDGIEFEPKYHSPIPKNTKFEIYKGPPKTDTSILAVSYGLRGDASASTPKYDTISTVSLPTFYFYNDRLDVKNQLDYGEKYTLTSTRWWGYSTSITINTLTSASTPALAQYEAGSASKYFTMSQADYNKLIVGQSLFNTGGGFIGNVENKSVVSSEYRVYIDYARIALGAISSNVTYKIGKTHQNIVFKTENKFGDAIPNLGKFSLDAVFVDENEDTDITDSGNAFNPIRWHTAFPNAKRHSSDLIAVTANSENGLLVGPQKYLSFEKSKYQNDIIPNINSSLLNKPISKLSQMARVSIHDNTGISYRKYKENDIFEMRNAIYNTSFKPKTIENYLSETIEIMVSNTSSTVFTVSNLTNKIDLSAYLATNDIVLIDNYYYVIDTLNTKASDTTQTFTIKAKRLTTASTWTVTNTVENVDKKTLQVSAISNTSYINFDFESDTEVEHLRSNLVTINSHSIDKTATRMYKTRIVTNNFPNHVNEIEFSDKNNRYAKILDASRKFYQNTNISRLYYYAGAYAITDDVFTGKIEDIKVNQEDGQTFYEIVGRDDTSKLLNKTITTNLKSTSDMNYSSITPILNVTSHGSAVTVDNTSLVVTVTGVANGTLDGTLTDITKYGIIANQDGILIGEVSSASISNTTVTITLSHPTTLVSSDITSIKYYDPFSDSYHNYISGVKMLGSNILNTDTTLNGVDLIEKGLSFDKGLDIDYSSAFSTTPLFNSSNTGSFETDNTLGYDINTPKSIAANDSDFGILIGNENGVSIDQNDITTINSESFDIVNIQEKDESNSILSVAPRFPMILGRIEVNSSDTRGNASIYTVNNNVNVGGIIHTLDDTHSNLYTPKQTIRYWDMQKFPAGTLTRTSDTIYYSGKRPQKIQGYAVGYGVRVDGTTVTPTETPTNLPINGSNTLNNWTYLQNFYGQPQSKLIQSYATVVTSGNAQFFEANIPYGEFEQIDPRTLPFELMATGDIYPNSKLRWTHMGNTNHSSYTYDNYGILLEEPSRDSATTTTHQKYDGTSNQTISGENNFETNTITTATQSPSNMRRYGVIRLVEATFDWHFNPIDYESLKNVEEIPTVNYFDYVMMAKPTLLADSDSITIGNANDVHVNAHSGVSDVISNVYFSTDYIGSNDADGTDTNLPNGFIAGRHGTDWDDVNDFSGNYSNRGQSNPLTANSLLEFAGYASGSDIKYIGTNAFQIHRTTDHIIDNLTTSGNSRAGVIEARQRRTKDIRFTNVFISGYETKLANFKLGHLKDGSSEFLPQNIILPIITQDESGESNNKDKDFSPFIHADDWFNQDTTWLHISRVMNALSQRKNNNQSRTRIKDKYGLGITSDNADTATAHPYNNCIGVFKDLVDATTANKISFPNNTVVSGPLSLDTTARYDAYLTALGVDNDQDQLTLNSMIQEYPSTNLSMGGTRVSADFLINKRGLLNSTSTTHTENTHEAGTVASAQMVVKPIFDLTAVSNTLVFSNSNKTVTFTHNAESLHTWLSFVPNLTGHYIVSEKLTSGNTIRQQKDFGHPNFISKITSHTVSTAPTDSAIETHTIIFDTAIDVSNNGTVYRLMKINETTFDNTTGQVAFNVMQHDETAVNFKSLGKDDEDFEFQESVYEMFLLLNIDTANTFIESRTNSTVNTGFTDGEIINAYVTDGENSSKVNITVSTTRKKLLNVTESALVWDIGGTVNGNGVVSVSEIFDITLGTKTKLKDAKVCHIGTTFDVGSNIDTEIQNIVEEAGLEFDHTNTYIEETNNIVESQGSNGNLGIHINKINCYSVIENVSVGDILYTEQGKLVGVVESIGQGFGSSVNNMIVFTALYYTPQQGDELVKINKTTFTTNINLQNVDLLTTLNALASKRGIEYNLKNGQINTREFGDTKKLRKYEISYEKSDTLLSVENSVSMFDKANKVTVIGDNVSFTLEQIAKDEEKELTVIDPNIKTQSDAEVKATRILETHNTESYKIKLRLQKKGLELLEAGDIMHLKLENHNIPMGDYMVFEIENILSGVLVVTVGTFDKNIAERLSEIRVEKGISDATTFSKNQKTTISGKSIFDDINISEVSFAYTISSTEGNSNLGFDDTLGFTETVGIETSTQVRDNYDSAEFQTWKGGTR
tara:strand:+ start:7767 stop:14636 length:6870 start_codon:yes stop_codon:yes gene_type:complete